MRRQSIIFLLPILLLSIIRLASSKPQMLHPLELEQQLHFRGRFCLDSEKVSNNSAYNSNIDVVLSNLLSRSLTSKSSHFSAGTGPDLVNGLFLCRADLAPLECNGCVNQAYWDFWFRCPNQKEAINWYEECMLRYSNQTILATEETKPFTWFRSFLNVSRPDLFPTLLNRTLEGLILDATFATGQLKYATGNTSFTPFEGLYGLAICTPDITASQCEHCLRTASSIIPSCCGGFSQWTMVFLPSCQLRYDTTPFIIFPPSPPPLVP